jgi:hypothetical protein
MTTDTALSASPPHDPKKGVRIGEASNPGPGNPAASTTHNKESQDPSDEWLGHELDKTDDAFWIVTHNINSLYASAERHTSTKAHVYAWQEAEVPGWERRTTGDKLDKLGYRMRYGWEESNHCDDNIQNKVAIPGLPILIFFWGSSSFFLAPKSSSYNKRILKFGQESSSLNMRILMFHHFLESQINLMIGWPGCMV